MYRASIALLAVLPSVSYANSQYVNILSADNAIYISVANTSGSADVSERDLQVISASSEVTATGEAICGGGASLTQLELLFGSVAVVHSEPDILLDFSWDGSTPLLFPDNPKDNVDFSITHTIDLPTTWNGLVQADGFNAVAIVEIELWNYVYNGGSASDFLSADDVFEESISLNVLGTCVEDGVESYVLDTLTITAYVFYHGDPNMASPITVNSPDEILYDSKEASITIAAETDTSSRVVSFERFEVYNVTKGGYLGELWSGYVTYPSDAVCRETQMAVTSDGACVRVEGCVPEEFTSCRTVDGCCAGL